MILFLNLKMRQRRLTFLEISIVGFILAIVLVNIVDAFIFNIEQIISYEMIFEHQEFYKIWKSVTEMYEDIIILVNGIGFLLILLKVD
jgi:hypothetical protein